MLKTLAWRNVRRSISDYRIYFLTLSAAVCLFYLFNSLTDQQQIIELTAIQAEMLGYTRQMLSIVSVAVTVILGFLIVYANHFLLNRRKKEFGLYLTLGMSQRHVLTILGLETIFIALLALVLGLVLGVIGTQIMSLVTAQLFSAELKSYHFLISWSTIFKTTSYFALMFLIVATVNAWRFSRYQLRELLVASQRSQASEPTRILAHSFGFSLSIASVVVGYSLIVDANLIMKLFQSLFGGLLIIGGTIGALYLGTPLALWLIQKQKRYYFRTVNLVVIRQFFAQLHTSLATISVITLLLFATMTTLALGFSYKEAVATNVEKIAPFDATIEFFPSLNDGEQVNITAAEALARLGMNVQTYGDYREITLHQLPLTQNDFFAQYQDANPTLQTFFDHGATVNLDAIAWSDYQALMQLQGEQPRALAANEVILLSNVNDMEGVLAKQVATNQVVTIAETNYTVQAYLMQTIQNEDYGRDVVTLVLPDEVLSSFPRTSAIMNFFFEPNQAAVQSQELRMLNARFVDSSTYDTEVGYFRGITHDEVYEATAGQTALMVYVGIYLGLVCLLASVTVLAIQQLMEVSQSHQRYRTLQQIGVTRQEIKKLIGRQISFYFGLPLAIALVHTGITIPIVIQNVAEMNFTGLLNSLLLTIVIFVCIYGGYGYATYLSYCQILKEKNHKGR